MVGCCVSFFVSLIEVLRFGCAPVGVCLALQVSTGWKGFVCVCVKRTVVAVSKETDSLTERKKRIEEDKTNGEEGVASRMQLPGHQMWIARMCQWCKAHAHDAGGTVWVRRIRDPRDAGHWPIHPTADGSKHQIVTQQTDQLSAARWCAGFPLQWPWHAGERAARISESLIFLELAIVIERILLLLNNVGVVVYGNATYRCHQRMERLVKQTPRKPLCLLTWTFSQVISWSLSIPLLISLSSFAGIEKINADPFLGVCVCGLLVSQMMTSKSWLIRFLIGLT